MTRNEEQECIEVLLGQALDRDRVPPTAEAVVDMVFDSLSVDQKEKLAKLSETGKKYDHFCQYLVESYSFGVDDSPIRLHTQQRFGVNKPEHVASLVLSWLVARCRGLPFDPAVHCQKSYFWNYYLP